MIFFVWCVCVCKDGRCRRSGTTCGLCHWQLWRTYMIKVERNCISDRGGIEGWRHSNLKWKERMAVLIFGKDKCYTTPSQCYVAFVGSLSRWNRCHNQRFVILHADLGSLRHTLSFGSTFCPSTRSKMLEDVFFVVYIIKPRRNHLSLAELGYIR